jgi:hypothetical protein
MQRIFVTPRAGLKVRDPHRPADGYLPADGAWKEDSSAWRRLARAGDVIVATEATMKPAARAAEAKK